MMRESLAGGKHLGISRSGHYADERAPCADLVEECERARLAFEHGADEAPQRDLDLGLDRSRLAQAGDGLDVEPAVGAQQLERGQ